jgi:hypothetical protein
MNETPPGGRLEAPPAADSIQRAAKFYVDRRNGKYDKELQT